MAQTCELRERCRAREMDDVGILPPDQEARTCPEAPLVPVSGRAASNSQQISTGPSLPCGLPELHGQKGTANCSVDYLRVPYAFSLPFLTHVALSMKETSQKIKNHTMVFMLRFPQCVRSSELEDPGRETTCCLWVSIY